MYKQVCSIRTLVRITFFILVVSIFAVVNIAVFSSKANAQEGGDTDVPKQCDSSFVNYLEVESQAPDKITGKAGAFIGDEVIITNFTEVDRVGLKGYAVLRHYSREKVGYPIAFGETEMFNVGANSLSRQGYKMVVPNHAKAGRYVVDIYVGSYSAETAMSLAMANVEPSLRTYINVDGTDDELGIVVDNLRLGDNQIALGEPQILDNTNLVIAVNADVLNTAGFFAEGSVEWNLYEGLLPSKQTLIETQTQDFMLVPEQKYLAEFMTSVTPGQYLLMATVKNNQGSTMLLIPISHVGHQDYPSVIPLITNLGVEEKTGSTEVHGCVEYLMANSSNDQVISYPMVGTLSYRLSADSREIKAGDILFGSAPDKFALEGNLNDVRGNYTVSVELLRDGEVIDSVSIEKECGEACDKENMLSATKNKFSILNTFIGVTMLLVIISLPLLGAYQVGRKGRNRRSDKSVSNNTADTEEDLEL